MRKAIPLIFFMFLSINSISQYSRLDYIPDSTIKKNKVFTCKEYDVDSVNFFKKYPNGYYTYYDKKGNILKQNSYYSISPIDINSSDFEYVLHYIRDNNGKIRMKLWYDNNGSDNVSNIYHLVYDSIDKNIGYYHFNNNSKPESFEFNSYAYRDTLTQEDSIIKPNLKFYFKIYKNNDTISKTYQYYSQQRVDSTTHFYSYNKNKFNSKTSIIYEYDINNKLTTISQSRYNLEKEKYSVNYSEKLFLSNNGLPYKALYFAAGKYIETRFKYTFYK
jgi:hypothetical protein